MWGVVMVVLSTGRLSAGRLSTGRLSAGRLSARPTVRMIATSTDKVAAAMRYVPLGSSGIQVSSCCLGTMTWGSQNTDDEAFDQLERAWQSGVNFLDTAEGYPIPMNEETQGRTDRAIARWLSKTGRPRESVILATKVCGYNDRFTWFREGGGPTRVSAAQIIESVDASLKG